MRRDDHHPTVLLIEEDPLVGLAVGETLAEAGYRVAGPLATQAQALAWMAGRAPDLAVIDLPLRDGDGSRLARALRARGVPFLVHADRSADACTELSLAPRLTKPAWHRDLVLVLDQLAREVRPE
ncbi:MULTISPECIES: response regulator [Methylobacterium]|uniref:Transcriptional regulator, Crp/Fnr family n=2 Tax=Methylobacterium TaxID=407 RepID=A0A0C6FGD9_9HYPH|nr:response regulator [Methylobacterium aquaticum]BAQ46117.1 transcriptional regulator, Crp/Fnr family [Methylobacterium aquaticum]